MGIDAVNSNQATVASLGGVADKDKLGQAQFMQLMIAQLRNQDPTKPMDPSEFLGQLAQFGTVSGIQDMQKSLTTLSDALRSSQLLGGTSLVGRSVLATADTAMLGATGSINGAIDIPESTTAAVLVVTDASGQLIRRLPLSTQQGMTEFQWDGTDETGQRVPAGNYTIAAIASVGGADQQLETQLASRVGSVTLDPATNNLTVNTDIGPIPLSRVRRVM
ncbi:MAG: flagellar hook assembly protein FlgD [Steroidobacteraceae bacterium]